MSVRAQLKAALNELYDSDGENIRAALDHLQPAVIEALKKWNDERWENAITELYILTPWKLQGFKNLWETRGEEIRAAIESELNTYPERSAA